MKHSVRNLIMVAAGVVSLAFMAQAFAASESVKLDKAELDLLDGGRLPDQRYLAGLQIRLIKDVKTYWRMPGDSGLPPVFDFSASQNVDHVEVKWPAPSRIEEAEGTILGFKDQVIFPLIITPKDVTQPVTLAVTIDFGLCDTLCLPAKADLARAMTDKGDSVAKSGLDAFLARVPETGTLKGAKEPAILAIAPQAKGLVLTVASQTPLTDVILEAQGSWYFGAAAITPEGAGRYQAFIPIEQKPSSATLAGLSLTITSLAGANATETVVILDQSGSIH